MSSTDEPRLSDRVRRFLEAPNYASLATLDPDGSPRQAVVWYRLDSDAILVNSRADRRWPQNLRRDGRASVAVFDTVDPYVWVGLTAEVDTIDDDPVRGVADIQALSHRYHPGDERRARQFEGQSRVTFRLRVTGVHEHLD